MTIAWMNRTGITDVLLTIHWWGGVEIVFTGDKLPDPSAYRPYVLTRPRWNSPCRENDVPLAFACDPLTVRLDFSSICPCVAGEVTAKQAAGQSPARSFPTPPSAAYQSLS